ncbi:MAG: type IV toxin-antitoxin system AbiEi family antitoxin domain-containing protein [Actinomycetota bacterium]|nr:type IV toxin-antitoxin system AbiEi family antitoxin domain-containing protein [Actinomycetota bacterium]
MDRVAARQWGLISVPQLHNLGWDDNRIEWHTRAGDLIRLRRQIYRLPGTPQCWEQVVLAAALAAGDLAVVSHTTAASLWALKHSVHPAAGLHITAPHQIRMIGVTGHQARLSAAETTVHRAIPVTTPERTIIDLAATLRPTDLGECVDDALRRGLIRIDRLRRLAGRVASPGAGRRLLAPMHQALADRVEGYRPGDSDWERAMDRQWDQLGLPAAQRQYRVSVKGRNYRIDRAIPVLKIGVEWEGFATHGTRSGFDHGSDRRADLTADGWHMIDFTSRSSPQRIARAVLRAVEERRGLRRPETSGASGARIP